MSTLGALASACLAENPSFDGPSAGETSGSSGPGPLTSASTSQPLTTSASSSGGSEGATGTSATGTSATTSGATDSSSTGVEPFTGSGTAAETDAPVMQEIELLAIQAGCIALPEGMLPLAGAAACEAAASAGNAYGGIGEMSADAVDAAFENRETRILMRFPWDPALAGAEIKEVSLFTDVTDYPGEAMSDSTGALWRSAPFDLDALGDSEPALLGDMPLVPSQGAVSAEDAIVWTLPASVIESDQDVYLQITTSSNDGVNYWTLSGPFPQLYPRLRVIYLK